MNFFEQQHQARRRTRTLVLLFTLAVIAIVIAVNAVAAALWLWSQGQIEYQDRLFPRHFFLANTLITVGLIVGGTLLEIFNLRDGGEAVAKMAGGREVSPATTDLRERRLLNVVEEMALASGIACPKVYLLDHEDAINAFAAGYNPNEAVVAVTRGTLQRLTRDELQGVIGHEFSHILNGDMRLNVRLIGVLFGIQMIAGFGRQLLNLAAHGSVARRNDRGPSPQWVLFALGVALFVIGYIGVIFGRLIKSAVSRQREFLADASAVQFTRNPDGIGNALRKIGGLTKSDPQTARIQHPNAEHLSHMFLAAVSPGLLAGWYATHPPVAERLRRIFGRQVELLSAPELPPETVQAPVLPDIPYVASGFAGAPQAVPAAASYAAPAAEKGAILAPDAPLYFAQQLSQRLRLAPELDSALHEPQAACAIVYALLLDRGVGRAAQIAVLDAQAQPQGAFVAYLASAIERLPAAARLPLLDLAMPALRQLPQGARTEMLALVERLIAADLRVTLAEFVLETVLTRRLAADAGRAVAANYATLAPLRDECALLLSLVAQVAAQSHAEGDSRQQAAVAAFARGAAACTELGLGARDLHAAPEIGFVRVKAALDRANHLTPLAKPLLIKALAAAAVPPGEVPPVALADLLRAICAALEAPLHPAVADAYAACAALGE